MLHIYKQKKKKIKKKKHKKKRVSALSKLNLKRGPCIEKQDQRALKTMNDIPDETNGQRRLQKICFDRDLLTENWFISLK